MNTLKKVLFLIFTALGSIAYGQISKANVKAVLEQDYLSALTGLQELTAEMRSTKNKSISNELKQAKKSLIADYTSGDYALFVNRAIVEAGISQKRKAYMESSPSAFMTKYSAKKYSTPSISVTDILHLPESNWYKVSYTSTGEVASQPVKREAIISASGNRLLIRRLSYADRSNLKKQHIVQNTTKAVGSKKPKPSVRPKEVIVPAFSSLAIDDTTNGMKVSGKISNPYSGGVITAYLGDQFIQGVSYNETTKEYRFKILKEHIQSSSLEVRLKYEYGTDKFITSRKNIVIVEKPGEPALADGLQDDDE